MTPAAPSPALPGTRPQGSRDEREAAARVREMFTRIAPRYDLANHLLSFSLDRLWRRRTARYFRSVLQQSGARVLDLCCGTGDLAFALDRIRSAAIPAGAATPPPAPEHSLGGAGFRFDAKSSSGVSEEARSLGGRSFSSDIKPAPPSRASAPEDNFGCPPIIGSDFVEPMLMRAREKARSGHRAAEFAAADALHLPFPDASFDLVTSAFGFRNLANYELGLREMARVLKPGGQVGILEFSEPGSGPMAALFRFYFRRILPWIGAAISGDREAYAYLPSSVQKFPSPIELTTLLEKTGFADVRASAWNFGSVILHSARRT